MKKETWQSVSSGYLVELLGDSRTNDPSIESSNIDCDQRFKRFGSPVRIDHVPKYRPFPLCVHIVCVFPPQIASHFHWICLVLLLYCKLAFTLFFVTTKNTFKQILGLIYGNGQNEDFDDMGSFSAKLEETQFRINGFLSFGKWLMPTLMRFE
jgi:hypothetical protein